MPPFFLIALMFCCSVAFLIIWPLMLHPSLSRKHRILLSALIFFLLVPLALMLYAWLGVPQMAVE